MNSNDEQILLDAKNFGTPDKLLMQRDQAYNDRNRVIAAFARLARCLAGPTSIWRAGIGYDQVGDVENGWRHVVFIDTPNGQVSWHFHDDDLELFHDLPAYTGKWDGHDTEEKYRRLDENI